MGGHSLRRSKLTRFSLGAGMIKEITALPSAAAVLLLVGMFSLGGAVTISAQDDPGSFDSDAFDDAGQSPDPMESRQVLAGPSVFSDPTITLSPVVEEYIEIYSSENGLSYIEDSLQRGRPYRDFVLSTLERYRLPRELYYLALIESGFDARAVSRSGATGLWQFMENSLEEWMRIDSWVDERRDFYRSTIAAAEKLARNFTILEDWLLAIAAYNAGLGHIQRAVAAAETDNFWELASSGLLSDQTADYVPKFLAIAWIAEHAGRHGISTDWQSPLIWTRVTVPGGTDLETLAELSGLDPVALHSWNVHLNAPRIPAGVTEYELNIPEMHRRNVELALELLPDYRSFMRTDRQ